MSSRPDWSGGFKGGEGGAGGEEVKGQAGMKRRPPREGQLEETGGRVVLASGGGGGGDGGGGKGGDREGRGTYTNPINKEKKIES